jgi:hypothetical protein
MVNTPLDLHSQQLIFIKLNNMTQLEQYLNMISGDFQLDKNHPEYCGFLNVDPSDSGEFTTIAVDMACNPKKYTNSLSRVKLELESGSWEEEMIFVRKN